MIKKFHLKLKYIRIFVLYLGSSISFAYSSVVYSSETVLTVGVVPQFEQRKLFRNWKPILTELEKLTGFKFNLVGSAKIPIFENQFNQGVYDIAYMNPYHVLKAHASQQYIPLVRDSKNFKGVLVVNASSSIKSIKELTNKAIAFPSPNALGASLLMRSILIEKFKLNFKAKFVHTHSSVYLHVAKNMLVAGGGVDRTLAREPQLLQNNLRVIYKTPEIVSHPIVIHPRVPAAKREAIKAALFKLFSSSKGKELFSYIPINNLVAASIEDYQPLQKFNLDKYFKD